MSVDSSYWHRVFVVQKRAVREIVGVFDDVSERDYFQKEQIIALPRQLIQQIATLVQLILKHSSVIILPLNMHPQHTDKIDLQVTIIHRSQLYNGLFT